MSWCNYGQKWLYLFHPCKNLYNTCSNRSLIESIKKIHGNDLCKFIVNGIMKNQHKIHRCFCKYLLSAIDGFFVWSAYPHSMFHEKKSKTACNMVQSMWTCFVCKKKKGNILFIFFHVPFSDNQWIHNSSVSSHSFVRSKLMNLSFPQIFFSVIKRAIYWLPKASKKGWPERRYRMSSVFKRIHDKIMLIDCIKMDKILASFFSGSWYFKHHWPFNY